MTGFKSQILSIRRVSSNMNGPGQSQLMFVLGKQTQLKEGVSSLILATAKLQLLTRCKFIYSEHVSAES